MSDMTQTVHAGDNAADGREFDEAIMDSNAISPVDKAGNPIPVTIPIALAPGITAVYTTRLGGVSEGDWASCNLGGKVGDDAVAVTRNREALSQALGMPISLVNQVHSGEAVDVDELGIDTIGTMAEGGVLSLRVDADAQVSSRSGVALGMFAADCLPVLLADPQTGVIAAAHCGRRGLQAGVLRHTVELMETKGASPERIVVTLGPSICADCYEVGDEIADEFDAQFPGTFSLTRFGGPGINISAAALQELRQAGVPADNVVSSLPRVAAATQYLAEDPELEGLCATDGEGDASLHKRVQSIREGMCTVENPLWYSHRRAALAHKPHEGRMLALIMREG